MSTRILLTGAGGQLASELAAAAEGVRRWELVALGRDRLDVRRRDQVLAGVFGLRPDLVIHTGAFTDVDRAEADPKEAFATNALGCRHLAEAVALAGGHLVVVSSDYVFDGRAGRPYHEWDPPNPLSVYGASKLAGEREAQARLPSVAVVRTSWLCGTFGRNALKTILGQAAAGGPLRYVTDQRGCPTLTSDLAPALLELGLSRRPGLFHLTNAGEVSWYELAQEVLLAAGLDPSRVEPIQSHELVPPRSALRPAYSALCNAAWAAEGFDPLPDFRPSLEVAVKRLLASS